MERYVKGIHTIVTFIVRLIAGVPDRSINKYYINNKSRIAIIRVPSRADIIG